jgi:MFS family permease
MGHSPEGLALPEKDKTSIWLALKNPVFKRYWLAALVSGTCVAAHNTAAFTVLGQGDDSAILISLMSTLSSLPFALFTLPAGALADMAERKKILCATSTWQASIALCLAILALTNSLNPYVILISVFLSATELWIAAQRAVPDWARGRLNATIVMCSQAATALGAVIWGSAAAMAGVVPTFLGAGLLAMVTLAVVHFAAQKRLSIDFAADLNLEPAAITIFSHDLNPMRLSQAADNPVSIVTEFAIDPRNRAQCTDLMREIRLAYLRNGARNWHLYEDCRRSNRFQMEVVASSWNEYQRQNERLTREEKNSSTS